MSLPNKHARFNIAPNCICARDTVDCHVGRLVFCYTMTKYTPGCLNNIYIAFGRVEAPATQAGPRMHQRRSRALRQLRHLRWSFAITRLSTTSQTTWKRPSHQTPLPEHRNHTIHIHILQDAGHHSGNAEHRQPHCHCRASRPSIRSRSLWPLSKGNQEAGAWCTSGTK